jgi:hypothetical protein
MSFFDFITGGFIKEVGDAIDKNVTSDEERLKLRNEFEEIKERMSRAGLEAEKMIQENVTSRHAADMQSDNKLSKNIRPLSLVALTLLTIVWFIVGMVVLDDVMPAEGGEIIQSVKYKVWLASLELLTVLDLLAFGFYFGGRSIEKAATKIMVAIKK